MPTHNEHESHNKPGSVREGYEVTDVSVQGIMVFLIGLAISSASSSSSASAWAR